MSIFESIVTQFNTHIDVTSRHIESLIPHIAEATHLFTEALLAEKKILCCTSSDNFPAGNQFCHSLMNGTDLPRPGLPAVFLGANTSSALSLLDNKNTSDAYARQVHVLGQKGDVLFVISSNGHEDYLAQAISAAHEKQMMVVALLSNRHNDMAAKAHNADVSMMVQAETLQQTLLLQYLVSVILANQLEQQLFGNVAP